MPKKRPLKSKLARRFLIAPSVGLALLALLSLGLIYQLTSSAAQQSQYSEGHLEVLKTSANLQKVGSQVNTYLSWASIGYNQKKLDSLESDLRKRLKSIELWMKPDSNTYQVRCKNLNDSASASLEKYKNWIGKAIQMSSIDAGVASTFLGPAEKSISPVASSLEECLIKFEQQGQELKAASAKNKKLFFVLLIGGLFSAFLITITVASLIGRNISKTVELINHDLDAVAHGNFSNKIALNRHDELGQMLEALDKAKTDLSSLLTGSVELGDIQEQISQEVLTCVSSLGVMASRLFDDAKVSEEKSNTAVHSMEDITSSATGINQSITTIAASTEQMSVSIQEVSKNCQSQSKLALDTDTNAQEIRTTLETLSKSVNDVSGVIEVIEKVAASTRLLALNATIEAAAAGEAGRGFAVVAGEVKELAERTGGATQGIRDQISHMQNSMSKAVESIGNILDQISSVTQISQSISAAVEEQSATASQVANNISGVEKNASSIVNEAKLTTENMHILSKRQKEMSLDSEISRETVQAIYNQTEWMAAQAKELQNRIAQFTNSK